MVPHLALVNFLLSMAEAPGCRAEDTLVSVTTPSFDIFGLELYLPLLQGARVVIAGRDTTQDADLLGALLEKEKATLMQATPATWRLLLESGWTGKADLKVLCGGEALPVELAKRLNLCVAELWNVYGPTETTIWSSTIRVDKERESLGGESVVTLGQPIANTTLYVVDAEGELSPPGVPGELRIGGAGVAVGYWGRPDLTAERFLPDPFAATPGARLYRTGDLVRRRHDFEFEYLGRLDFQVKIRGFRIELGEIESVLASHPEVAEAVVVAKSSAGGGQRLLAYFVPRASVGTAELEAHCAAALPDYMVPTAFVSLPSLPLTPNAKVDRKALPEPMAETDEDHYEAPREGMESLLANAWQAALKVERVGRQDSFFGLGGDSILVIPVITRLRKAGLVISAKDFFMHPRLADLASRITPLEPAPIANLPAVDIELDDEELADILRELS